MGMFKLFSSSSYDDEYDKEITNLRRELQDKSVNPVATNFVIERNVGYGHYLVLMVHYPDCTNYEGRKILVYASVSLFDLINQKSLDPHFAKNPYYHSPIARFVPTEDGWKMAEAFVKAMIHG